MFVHPSNVIPDPPPPIYRRVLDALCQQGDPQYKRFHLGLVPGLAPDAFLGVRMPVLRKEARRILKEAPDDFLKAAFAAVDPPYEIRMLQGLVIAQLPCSLPQRLQLCLDFLPLVDNWAVCDSFCAAMTCAKKEPASVLAFLRPLLASEQVYHVRFACVMLLHYFMDDIHIQDTLALYDGVSHPDYYVKMAVAWGISQGLTVQWEATIGYLCGATCHLDEETYRKALQKGLDSYRIPPERKALLRNMRKSLPGGGRPGAISQPPYSERS